MTKQILILGLDRDARRTLLALYELTTRERPTPPPARAQLAAAREPAPIDASALARRLGVSTSAVMANLRALDARGLVWAARCRLTLTGLATAARLSALLALAGARGRAA